MYAVDCTDYNNYSVNSKVKSRLMAADVYIIKNRYISSMANPFFPTVVIKYSGGS
jgi:hypothetical protein